MAKRKPKLTKNQQEFKKQVNRIRRFYKRAEKRGFEFPEKINLEMPARVTRKKIEELKEWTAGRLYIGAKYVLPSGARVSAYEGRTLERKIASRKGQRTKETKKLQEEIRKRYDERLEDYYHEQELEWEEDEEREFQSEQNRKVQEYREQQYEEYVPDISYIILEQVENMIYDWSPSSSWGEAFAGLKAEDQNLLMNVLRNAIDMEGRDSVASRMEEYATEIIQLADQVLYDSNQQRVQQAIHRFQEIIQGRPLSFQESIRATEASEINEDYDTDYDE